MKRLLLFIFTLLCANVLFAQTFWLDSLRYNVTSTNQVEVYDANSSIITANIPTTVTYQGITYSVTSIGNNAFYNCSSLTSVNIPNSVTSIGYLAFWDCSSLTSVTIPNSVTSIGGSAFYSCSSLTTLNFNAINCSYNYTHNNYNPFRNCPITTINIGDSVQRIPDYFANNRDNLTSVTIGNSVDTIGDFAFFDCDSLTSVTIGNSVTSIGESAFHFCTSLTSVNIPNSVTSIGVMAFSICSSLTSVTIGNSVTSIGDWAFADCYDLTSVTIGNSVTSIGERAFRECSSLTSVTIPNSVTCIGGEAFYNCSSLTSVTIPNSVTSIGSCAFYNCSSLTSVTIPNSVTYIGTWAFGGCSSLTTLNYNAINCNDFYGYVYDNVYGYYNYHQFAYCPITTINIGDSVQRIPNNFAYNLDSLTSVTITNSVDTIGDSAFYSCNSLTSITCLADIPPALGSRVFNNTPSNKILYVNCGLINDYISSWGNYFNSNNIHEITFDINTYVNNESRGSVAIERNNCSTATLTATANSGYSFLNWNDGNTENPRLVSLTSDTSFVANFIPATVNTDITATICQGQTYTENGFNVSESGVYTQTLTAINGADSIVTLTLNVNPTFNTELSANICQGQVYNENGFNVSEAGVYTQNLTSVNGCDSIVTLSLNINPIFNTELSATICQGQVYNENGFNVSEAGVYTQTLTSVNGCDSVVTLTVSVNPTFDTTINATINAGEMYSEFGFNESEAGTYVQNLQTVNGCDSTITLILDVNSSLTDVEYSELSFYPNPTNSKITFSSTIESIEVIDLTGRCVLTFSNAREINIESLPSGAYYLRLTNNDKAIMRKVIKE